MTTWVFIVLFVVFSVVCGKRGHLAVEAHNLANSIIPLVSQSHQRAMCWCQTTAIIAWLFCDDIAPRREFSVHRRRHLGQHRWAWKKLFRPCRLVIFDDEEKQIVHGTC